MKSIAIIYGSSTEHTKNAAERMAELLADYSPTLSDIYDGDEEPFLEHDVLILGVSTWGVQDLQDDWNDFYPKLEKLDLTGKTVALFGLGDASIYPSSFVDAIGILYELLQDKGVTFSPPRLPQADQTRPSRSAAGRFCPAYAGSGRSRHRWCSYVRGPCVVDQKDREA